MRGGVALRVVARGLAGRPPGQVGLPSPRRPGGIACDWDGERACTAGIGCLWLGHKRGDGASSGGPAGHGWTGRGGGAVVEGTCWLRVVDDRHARPTRALEQLLHGLPCPGEAGSEKSVSQDPGAWSRPPASDSTHGQAQSRVSRVTPPPPPDPLPAPQAGLAPITRLGPDSPTRRPTRAVCRGARTPQRRVRPRHWPPAPAPHPEPAARGCHRLAPCPLACRLLPCNGCSRRRLASDVRRCGVPPTPCTACTLHAHAPTYLLMGIRVPPALSLSPTTSSATRSPGQLHLSIHTA